MTGWDLVAISQERIGDFWSLTQSQVYRELATMADQGLVEAGERGSRDRRPYTITAPGRSAFRDWVEQMPGDETIRFPMLLTLAFGRHLPDDRLSVMLKKHRLAHSERLRAYLKRLEEMKAEGDPYAKATLDFGITYEKAVLDWFDRLPADMTSG